eukprot:gene24558-17629_t
MFSRTALEQLVVRGARGLKTAPAMTEGGRLNKRSRTITQPKHQGASQAMLYATPEINTEEDLNKPQVGIASV